MGTWDVDPFDNDDAADWAADFEGADAAEGLALIADALSVANEEDYLEAPDGAVAVAAAQLVAWLADPAAADDSPYSEEAVEWARRTEARANRALIDAARRALRRVTSEDSELAELWAEAEEDDRWLAAVRRIDDALADPDGRG